MLCQVATRIAKDIKRRFEELEAVEHALSCNLLADAVLAVRLGTEEESKEHIALSGLDRMLKAVTISQLTVIECCSHQPAAMRIIERAEMEKQPWCLVFGYGEQVRFNPRMHDSKMRFVRSCQLHPATANFSAPVSSAEQIAAIFIKEALSRKLSTVTENLQAPAKDVQTQSD